MILQKCNQPIALCEKCKMLLMDRMTTVHCIMGTVSCRKGVLFHMYLLELVIYNLNSVISNCNYILIIMSNRAFNRAYVRLSTRPTSVS